MSVSSASTWRDRRPGYRIEKGGPDAIARRIDHAVQRVEQAGETPASGAFGYSVGSPQKNPDSRFTPKTLRMAGKELIDRGLLGGEFAEKIGEKGPLREATGEYINQLMSGMFGPGDVQETA